jgi:hypothetical protein
MLKIDGRYQKLMSEQLNTDKACHICQTETQWFLSVTLHDQVYVKIPLCDSHRPIRVEVLHAENAGIVGYDFDHELMSRIHYGEKREEFQMLGPEAPGLGKTRPL